MTRNVRTYDHFCLTARSLEQVGDRWTLLVIRDLLTGAKRFIDRHVTPDVKRPPAPSVLRQPDQSARKKA